MFEESFRSLQMDFEQEFFGNLIKYLDFIVPHCKEHGSPKTEMECVGSQYLHLYYNKKNKILVFRYEQGPSTFFKIDHTSIGGKFYNSTVVVRRLEFEYDDKRSTQKLFDEADKMFTVDVHYDFTVKYANRMEAFKDPITRSSVARDGYCTFEEKLRIFGLMNTMTCGVCSIIGEDWPEDFSKDQKYASEFLCKGVRRPKPEHSLHDKVIESLEESKKYVEENTLSPELKAEVARIWEEAEEEENEK